jgi:hypothetical protein
VPAAPARAFFSRRFDNGVDRSSNIFFALNRALRERKTDPATFQLWQGFLYFLMRALDKLDRFAGTVCVGVGVGVGVGVSVRVPVRGRGRACWGVWLWEARVQCWRAQLSVLLALALRRSTWCHTVCVVGCTCLCCFCVCVCGRWWYACANRYRGTTVQGTTVENFASEYPVGRPIQWAAFSSTSTDLCVRVCMRECA